MQYAHIACFIGISVVNAFSLRLFSCFTFLHPSAFWLWLHHFGASPIHSHTLSFNKITNKRNFCSLNLNLVLLCLLCMMMYQVSLTQLHSLLNVRSTHHQSSSVRVRTHSPLSHTSLTLLGHGVFRLGASPNLIFPKLYPSKLRLLQQSKPASSIQPSTNITPIHQHFEVTLFGSVAKTPFFSSASVDRLLWCLA